MGEPQTLLAIDQGTTSSRAILFSKEGSILHQSQKELTLHYPEKGWVEQSAHDIWDDTFEVCKNVIEQSEINSIGAIGITNQRETTVVWDKETGEPIYNAIVWQDGRTADYCLTLKEAGHEEMVREKTGLLLDPYFSATKIKWILDHVEGARDKAQKGRLLFGTIDSFLLWKLTDGKVHATDATNASRTMIYNIVDGIWDEELLTLFDIPRVMLPEVRDNVSDFGETTLFEKPLTIGGMAGDQQAATIGQACFEPGMVKSTYGTGCFALINIGNEFKKSKNNLLTTIAYRFKGKPTYAIEGSIFVAGAAIQWLRDNLELFADAAESEALALSVEDNNAVYFVPAFTGLGAPYWQPDATAIITGLTRESNKAHVVRAALEAQAYQTLDLMDAFISDSDFDPDVIRIDGGLVTNEFVCQFLADMLNKPVEVPQVSETTALGAAYLAGLNVGIYKSLRDVSKTWKVAKRYEPKLSYDELQVLYEGWKKAINQVLVH